MVSETEKIENPHFNSKTSKIHTQVSILSTNCLFILPQTKT